MSGTMDGFDPGPIQPVSRERMTTRWTLRFTQVFPHPATAVWRAVTEPDELSAWAPYTADRSLGTLGPARLIMQEGDERTEFDGEVTLVLEPSVLVHAWGRHELRWELQAVGSGTELTLLHTLAEGDEESELPMMAAGWHLCLLVAERLLDGTPIEHIFGEKARDYGFEALREKYEERLNQP
ncbi:MAG: SRPBCC domain-containing protein [Propionibacteriaceae bacterium]